MPLPKKVKKKSAILLFIIFSHILPVIVSAFYDQATHTSHSVKLASVSYWLWAFTWWSAWASLLTVPWAIYKLLTLSKKKSSYGEQMWDIIVAETNFISGVIFCCGGFYLTIHTVSKHPTMIYPLVGSVKTIYVWIFYNLFWHVLAPGLAFYYFWKYCSVVKLKKINFSALMINFLNPVIYLLYSLARPSLNSLTKSASSLPHNYPPDYPYPPFFWIMGEYSKSSEQKVGQSKFLFWSWRPSWQAGLIWLVIVVILGYLIFSLLFYFLVKIKAERNLC